MVNYERFVLENGLEVFVHEDRATPMAVVNLLYKVGSRNEHPEKTGFAHLFEHLMFGGSANIPEYDTPLQKVGGENNAFTSPDITNYYITLPSANLETAFWLESDRMMSLNFDPHVLEVQRKVVIEEFKQRYLNQPYGDIWLKLRPLAYDVHPYRWATIGKEISHIEHASMDDVQEFFYRWYRPNNAILVVAGDVQFDKVKELAEKWFGPIPAGPSVDRQIPLDPPQTKARVLEVKADVPLNAWYRVYKMPSRSNPDYHTTDLLSDILGRGKSTYIYQTLVKEKEYLNSFSAFITGSLDPGLLVLTGKLNEGVEFKQVEEIVDQYIEEVKQGIDDNLVEKVKNQAEASMEFTEVDLLNRAMALAVAAMMGNPELVNQEKAIIRKIGGKDIVRVAKDILRTENSSTLYYVAEKQIVQA
jgi:zinc protease